MRSTHYGPHTHRINRDHKSVEQVTVRDESMRGDNVVAWERRSEPVIEFLSDGPKSTREVAAWFRSFWWKGACFGAVMAEECVIWLEARGRVERGDDRKWRVK